MNRDKGLPAEPHPRDILHRVEVSLRKTAVAAKTSLKFKAVITVI